MMQVTQMHNKGIVMTGSNKRLIIKMTICFAALVVLGILTQIGAAYLMNGILMGSSSLSDVSEAYNKTIDELVSLDPSMVSRVIFFAPLIEEAVFRLGLIGIGMRFVRELARVKTKGKSTTGYIISEDGRVVREHIPGYWIRLKNLEDSAVFHIVNVFQAILFGIYHGNIVQGIYAFVLGMMLGIIYKYGGGILSSIVVHMIINASGLYITPFLPSTIAPWLMCVIGVAVLIVCALLVIYIVRTLSGNNNSQAEVN